MPRSLRSFISDLQGEVEKSDASPGLQDTIMQETSVSKWEGIKVEEKRL